MLLKRYWKDAEIMHRSNGSTLYEIEHQGRPAVLKFFQPSPIEDSGYETQEDVNFRYQRELVAAQAFAASRYGLPVLEHGMRMEVPYIISPKVEGRTLEFELHRGNINGKRALNLLRQLTEAVSDLHALGFIHRDLKPSNLLLSGDSLYLIDFGCTRSSREAKPENEPIYYSIGYTAPECFFPDQPEDFTTDTFSLSMIANELLRGQTPFEVWCMRDGDADPASIAAYLEFVASDSPPSLVEDLCWLAPELASALDRAGSLTRAVRPECSEILAALPVERSSRKRDRALQVA